MFHHQVVQIVSVSRIPKEELIFKAVLRTLHTVMDPKRLQDSRILRQYNRLEVNLYTVKIHILT